MAEVGEKKVDVWQGASETTTKLDAENHEADVIRDDPETNRLGSNVIF